MTVELPVELSLDGKPCDEIVVVSLRGVEAVNRCGTLRLVVDVPNGFTPPALSTSARLRVASGPYQREWSLIVTGVADPGDVPARSRLVLELRHPFAKLGLRRQRRIFQGQRTTEIVRTILLEHGLPSRDDTVTPGAVREYCTQYDESDARFVRRILAEEGLAFFFEPSSDGVAPLVMVDHPSRQPNAEGPAFDVVHTEATSGLVREEHHAFLVVGRTRVAPAGVRQRDFDLERPHEVVEERTGPLTDDLAEVTESSGVYGEAQPRPQHARASLEQARRRATQVQLQTSSVRLVPGRVIELRGFGQASTRLVAERAEITVKHAVAEGPTVNVAATLSDAARLARPARPRRRVVQALETATVVGPEGDDIYTDSLGRIRARFHWDRTRTTDAMASCWIRVSQAWAGTGWGTQFIPRVGMEVLIGYLEGDPDRPVVIGCLPNATHRSHDALPRHRTKSGIVTRSSPHGEGANKLIFEDAAGSEQILVRAQRDLDIAALNEASISVGANSTFHVGADHGTAITGNAGLRVGGAATAALASDATLTVGAQMTCRVGEDVSVSIDGEPTTTIEQSETREVRGDASHRVVGPWTLRADSLLQVVVGCDEADGRAEFEVRGTFGVSADGAIQLEPAERLVLRVGESSIELGPSEVKIRSPKVTLEGSEGLTASGDGPSLRLGKEAEMMANSISLYGSAGRLELDDDARVIGKHIQLNPKGKDPSKDENGEDRPVRTLNVRLTDEYFEPYAEKHYELRVEGLKLEGNTDSDGRMSQKVPATARSAALRLWTADFPQGPTRDYTFVIKDLPAADSVPGVCARLMNLGYYDGPTLEVLGDALRAALRGFQADHDLPQSGENDSATVAAIAKRHPS